MLITTLALTCHAKPENIPIETIITNSDLIVVATLTNVNRQETNSPVRCEGTLQVEETLKGPRIKVLTLEWFVSTPPIEDEADHAWAMGKKVLWLLKQVGTNTYEANYYQRVQNVQKKDEIAKLIKAAANHTSHRSVAPVPQVEQ